MEQMELMAASAAVRCGIPHQLNRWRNCAAGPTQTGTNRMKA
jgi:hypothetical protein